jgi:hypothetical protein
MRKYFLLLAALVMSCGLAFADATETSTINGRNMTNDKGVSQGVAIVDAGSGYTQNVDSRGAASVTLYPSTITSSTGGTLNTGALLYTGAARVKSVTCSGFGTAAGDYVLIYDALTATGTAKLECTNGTAKGTTVIALPNGASFATGIFADSNSDNVHVAVTYDY